MQATFVSCDRYLVPVSSHFVSKHFVFLNRLNPGLAIFFEVPIVPTVGTQLVIKNCGVLDVRVVRSFLLLEPDALLVPTNVKIHGSDNI